jgi:putative ABC transport system permease protein
MFTYYFRLGLRSLRRNMVLTGLMIAAIAVGIGACMTALTVFRAMSGDPGAPPTAWSRSSATPTCSD